MKYIDLKKQDLTFADLLKQDEIVTPAAWPGDYKVPRLVLHSSEVKKGDVFLAIPPFSGAEQGEAHLKEAIENKAAIIVKQHGTKLPIKADGVTVIDVENVRQVRSMLAQRIYHGQPSNVVAVTGTNGKTSVVNFCRQMWTLLGYKAASLGTLGYESDVKSKDMPEVSLTSPDPFALHQLLLNAKEAGVTHLALEASSHGIDQHRLDGITFAAGGFTNLSHDHLDYHGDMDAYFNAKARFFNELMPSGETAVLNADTNYFQPLSEICRSKGIKVIAYGKKAEDGICLNGLTIEGEAQIAHISIARHQYNIRLQFIGKFQVLNALCAMGLLIGSGEQPEKVVTLLDKLKPIPGRLELIGTTKTGGAVYVDYAHTPNALEEALLSVRPYVSGILTVMFGCGGDRDPFKRPVMGKIAGQYTDAQIITDDNPRSEDPAKIRHEILRQCTNAQEIPDRYKAIKRAIDRLGKNDGVLIAGKGHEQFQLVKNQKIPFDDRQIARDIILESGGQLAA
jgi:UDP-N-acetylmuramoyl-L-alanyl-D-glutamate--2,6-diaminopimelate ligase